MNDADYDAWGADSGGKSILDRMPKKTNRRAEMVDSYHLARHAYETQRESATMGYATEMGEYNEAHGGGYTFKHHLRQWAGTEGREADYR